MTALPFRTIAYWTFTLLVAFENAAGAMWSALRLEYLRAMLTDLGYPQYFIYILGPWQLACAAALLAPRLPRVKDWAYAGAFFNYSSAFVSHLLQGIQLISRPGSWPYLRSSRGRCGHRTDASWMQRPRARPLLHPGCQQRAPWARC